MYSHDLFYSPIEYVQLLEYIAKNIVKTFCLKSLRLHFMKRHIAFALKIYNEANLKRFCS